MIAEKALKVKNRLAVVQADMPVYNGVPAGQADQVNVLALMQTCEEPELFFHNCMGHEIYYASICIHG